jgi:hypothetical protein
LQTGTSHWDQETRKQASKYDSGVDTVHALVMFCLYRSLLFELRYILFAINNITTPGSSSSHAEIKNVRTKVFPYGLYPRNFPRLKFKTLSTIYVQHSWPLLFVNV